MTSSIWTRSRRPRSLRPNLSEQSELVISLLALIALRREKFRGDFYQLIRIRIMDVYRIDFVSLNESVKKMRLRTRLLEERGVKLPKAPSQRPAAVAAPVPLSVSEGDVVARQGPLSQPGAKDTSSSTPALVHPSNVPSQVPNKGISAPTVRAKTSQLPSKMAEGLQKDEELEMSVGLLCSAAIGGACRQLLGDLIPSGDHELETTDRNLLELLEPVLQQKGVEDKKEEELERAEKKEDGLHLMAEPEQNSPKEIPSGDHELENTDLDELQPALQQKAVEDIEKNDPELERAVHFLSSTAILDAGRELLEEMALSCDRELGEESSGLEKQEKNVLQQEKADLALQQERTECSLQEEKTEDGLHPEEPEQNLPKKIHQKKTTKKGWKARGRRVVRRLRRAFRVLTSCCRPCVAP
ncbi:uncharacterized protein LOC118419593 isoform X2 [Branchiostoma floridae]|uniref:Uncharacterized protein LOC118419593 isoform X2 n=1 Tax=Branchiostoma floridae TaxID=7739 RepID=A0A9J7LFQ6_BRAFL|nr:uncharacterized protein LOC118419593 isoform X2 [Branchiostoma floridae]